MNVQNKTTACIHVLLGFVALELLSFSDAWVWWSCWIVWTTIIMLYYLVCVHPGRGDFLCVLRPVSPAQCRVGI